jgi:serine/threonine protein kinase
VQSEDLRQLITTCINHDPKQRPGALQLLKHAFFADLAGVCVYVL